MSRPEILGHLVIALFALGLAFWPGDIRVGRALSSERPSRALSKSQDRRLRSAALCVGVYALGSVLWRLM